MDRQIRVKKKKKNEVDHGALAIMAHAHVFCLHGVRVLQPHCRKTFLFSSPLRLVVYMKS